MKMKIGEFLLRRLRQIGVRHVFGVPGDFNLQLLEQFKTAGAPEFIGTCNELNASYAADGYARVNGIGALLTTYGVGDLSAICGLAGACAEHVPVVMISGTPPLFAMEARLRMHHSLAEGNFDNVRVCLHQFTGASILLTPSNAAYELDRVLISCRRDRLPVCIQVPSNITYLEIEVPDEELCFTMPASDEERLSSAVSRICELLESSKSPVMLIDADVDRCGLAYDLYTIAKRRQIPYAEFRAGKGTMPGTDALYQGLYSGDASSLEAVRTTDCMIATAPCFSEASPMVVPQLLPVSASIFIRDKSVTIEGDVYEGVYAHELVAELAKKIRPKGTQAPQPSEIAVKKPRAAAAGRTLTQSRLWECAEYFLKPNDLVCAENGTSLTALGAMRFPRGVKFIAQPIWGSIGYSLPALLGIMSAAPERRAVLFIGDGSFQLTAQEWSTIVNRGLRPIVFLLNNGGYTIERYILGMNSAYNDIANWKYTELARVFASDKDCFCVSVKTEDELDAAMAEAEKCGKASLIEVQLRPDDAPEALKTFCAMTAELDYGPRGPQRDNKR